MRRTVATVMAGLIAAAGAAVAPAMAAAEGAPGSAPSGGQALASVEQAVRATLAERARVSLSLAGAAVGGSPSARVAANGSFDFSTATGGVTLAPAQGVTEPIVFSPLAVYIKPPASAASLLPKGKPWMVANFSNTEALATNFPQFVLQIESIDPAFTLDEIAWGAVAARHLGTGQVNGNTAERFSVTIDLARAFAGASGPARGPFAFGLHSELSSLGSGGGSSPSSSPAGSRAPSTSIQAEVWLDSQGRVVQMSVSPPGAGVGRTTTTASDFGLPVKVTVPHSSQTVDVAEITPSGERENNNGGDSDGG